MSQAFRLSISPEGIATIIFDLPGEKINKLTLAVLEELDQLLNELSKKTNVKALVFASGKEDNFIVGADLKMFSKLFEDTALAAKTIEFGHAVFLKLEKLPFPSIAQIHGACLGGGMELALACTYRIATDHPKTVLGLPEVSLGIIPGWGGTQRAPRTMGLIEGLNLVVSAKPLKAPKAFKLHLVDALAAWEFKEEKTKAFVEAVLTPKGKNDVLANREPSKLKHLCLEANPVGRALVFHKAKKQIMAKTKGFYPAPLLALQVIQDSYGLPLEEGLKIEAKGILDNMKNASDISQNLISLFFTSEALKKDAGAAADVAPRKIASTAVLGAGVMGAGITWLISQGEYPVRLKDVDYKALAKGLGSISDTYFKAVKDKRLKKYEADLKFQHITTTVDYSGFKNVDLVIEAATENLELKNKIFQEVEANVSTDTLIVTNTSSLSIAEMSKSFKHPERFLGMHFFNPVPRMPLVEIVAGPQTSPQAVATAVEICKKLNKTPIVVGDCRGFLVNRIFAMGANELMHLFEEGVDKDELDKLMLDFGYPMGPFTLADEVGIDVMAKVNKIFEAAYGDRMKGCKIMQDMYDKKWWGKKCGKGFYIYEGKNVSFNPEVLSLLPAPVKDIQSASSIEWSDRVMLSMINEAARCLQEKIITRPDYLDMALIMGTGFPPFRGGLLRYADKLGIGYVVDHLHRFEQKFGSRFSPCELLKEMHTNKTKFYT